MRVWVSLKGKMMMMMMMPCFYVNISSRNITSRYRPLIKKRRSEEQSQITCLSVIMVPNLVFQVLK